MIQQEQMPNTMFKDLTTVHAMNQQDMTKGYDNNTILGYMKKYIEPIQSILDLSKCYSIEKMFPWSKDYETDFDDNCKKLHKQWQKLIYQQVCVDVPTIKEQNP